MGVLSGILLVLASPSRRQPQCACPVQSRTAEIALRRAIGSSKWLIARIFLMEGVMLGVLGGSIGACSGMIATIILSLVQGWQAVLSPGFVVLGVGVGPSPVWCLRRTRRGWRPQEPRRCDARLNPCRGKRQTRQIPEV